MHATPTAPEAIVTTAGRVFNAFKSLVFWITLPVSLVSVYALAIPKVSISVVQTTDTRLPISHVVLVKNEGFFSIYDLNLTCHLLDDNPVIKFNPMKTVLGHQLRAGETATEICKSHIYDPNGVITFEVIADYRLFRLISFSTRALFAPVTINDGFLLIPHIDR